MVIPYCIHPTAITSSRRTSDIIAWLSLFIIQANTNYQFLGSRPTTNYTAPLALLPDNQPKKVVLNKALKRELSFLL